MNYHVTSRTGSRDRCGNPVYINPANLDCVWRLPGALLRQRGDTVRCIYNAITQIISFTADQ